MFSAPRSALRCARPRWSLSRRTHVGHADLARLLSTLAVLEHRDGKLNTSSLAVVSAGQRLGGAVTAFLAGSGTKAVAGEAAKLMGVEKIIYVDNPAYDKV